MSHSKVTLLLTLMSLSLSTIVLAHGGHGDEFKGQNTTNEQPSSIKVDSETVKQLGLKLEPARKRKVDITLKTTGQIETLPSQKVELTAPIPGRIIKLLVEPGDIVAAGQIVAILSSSELVELKVQSQEKKAEALATLKQAQADLELAQKNLERQKQIASSEITRAKTEITIAQELYERDRELVNQGALPRRQMLESQAHLEDGKTQLVKAINQKEVIEAENQIKRVQATLEAAKSRLKLSDKTYQTRLQQLKTTTDEQGLVVVRSPIAGQVIDRQVSLNQAFQGAGGKLMTILNDNQVFATANIYEKDLEQVKLGQLVKVKIISLPNKTFRGKIKRIGLVVGNETRVIPIQAELDNPNKQLKSGQFAEIEILTNKTPNSILVIPSSAVVEANGKKTVYLQNGNAFDAIEITLGSTFGDLVEVKTGLFEGDIIVTQRAPQLYAQSLRGDSKEPQAKPNKPVSPPFWLLAIAGGGLTVIIAIFGFWVGRSSHKKALDNLSLPAKIERR